MEDNYIKMVKSFWLLYHNKIESIRRNDDLVCLKDMYYKHDIKIDIINIYNGIANTIRKRIKDDSYWNTKHIES